MGGHSALGEHPGRIREVRGIDDQRIAFPVTDRIATIRRWHVIAMCPSVSGNDLEVVVSFRQHDHELWSLNDLSDRSDAEQAHIQSAESRRNASQCGVVLVTQSFDLLQCGWLI